MPAALIALQGQDVIGFLFDDRCRNIFLCSHSIDCDNGSVQRQTVQKLWNGGDFVAFAVNRPVPKDHAAVVSYGIQNMQGAFGFSVLSRPAQCLAVNRDDAPSAPLRRPGHERRRKNLLVNTAEDQTKRLFRSNPVRIGEKRVLMKNR